MSKNKAFRYGHGSGYGDGSGYGSGDGSGYGYGNGYGKLIKHRLSPAPTTNLLTGMQSTGRRFIP